MTRQIAQRGAIAFALLLMFFVGAGVEALAFGDVIPISHGIDCAAYSLDDGAPIGFYPRSGNCQRIGMWRFWNPFRG